MTPPNKKQKPARSWQEVAKEAQDHREASLARVKPRPRDFVDTLERTLEGVQSHPTKGRAIEHIRTVLHPTDVQNTEMLPENLIRALASGALSATDVTASFLRRAVAAQKLVSVYYCYSLNVWSIWGRRIVSQSFFPNEPWPEPGT